jgi:hypothetical protein
MATNDKGIKFSNLSTFKQEMDTILNGKVSTSDSRLTDARPASDVYPWAKATTKPTYTASEVGALATGDIASWAKAANKPSYSVSEINGALASSAISDWAKASTKPSYSVSEITGALASSSKGVANGVASLGSDGKVPTSQLPSYVDDVIEGYKDSSSVIATEQFVTTKAYSKGQIVVNDNKYYRFITNHTAGAFNSSEVEEIPQFPTSGETGKIYSDIFTNKTYRWSGSQYT